MGIAAAEVYQSIRAGIGGKLKGLGLRPLKSNKPAWSRAAHGGHLAVWFECHHRPLTPSQLGSSFSVLLQHGSSPELGSDLKHRCTVAQVLSQKQLEVVRVLNNGVVASLPPLPPEHPIFSLKEPGKSLLLAQLQERLAPYPRNTNIPFRYFSALDVVTWGAFFNEHFESIISRYEEYIERPGA